MSRTRHRRPLLAGALLAAAALALSACPVTPHPWPQAVYERVYFRAGSAEPLPESWQIVDEMASYLQAHPEVTRLAVAGHADPATTPPPTSTEYLSRQRADFVVAALVQRGGVAPGARRLRGEAPDSRRVARHRRSRRLRRARDGRARRTRGLLTGRPKTPCNPIALCTEARVERPPNVPAAISPVACRRAQGAPEKSQLPAGSLSAQSSGTTMRGSPSQ